MRFTRQRKSHDPCNCAVREPSVWVTEHSVFATVLLCRTRNKFSSSAKTKIVLIVWFGEYWRILSFIVICQWAIINETIKGWLMVHARSTSCRLCEKARQAFCPRYCKTEQKIVKSRSLGCNKLREMSFSSTFSLTYVHGWHLSTCYDRNVSPTDFFTVKHERWIYLASN